MSEYTTRGGRTVRVGQLYRDSRESNIRTLRVDAVGTPIADWAGRERCAIECTVVRQEYAGEVTEPMRATTVDAYRLTSSAFLLLDPGVRQ
ncbi:hypothetical protein AB0M12_41770 [Nocardia vinacea]|uniref:hypothetical protein n=1 Tax=Nocardia vinacea TaxID=96468 RepID=UPI003440E146